MIHLLVSRFACGTKDFITKEWVDYRLDLLEKYCYPSIVNQTNKNFKWLVFSTECNINEEQTERINKLEMMNHILLKKGYGYVHAVQDEAKKIKDTTDILVTSRVDCDDALGKHFIENIQNNINKKEDTFVLNFPKGIEYNLKTKNLTYRNHKDSNIFTTIIEKNGAATIVCEQHQRLMKKFKVYQINENEYNWLQIIHEKNIYTTKNLGKKIPPTDNIDIKKTFNITI